MKDSSEQNKSRCSRKISLFWGFCACCVDRKSATQGYDSGILEESRDKKNRKDEHSLIVALSMKSQAVTSREGI